MKKTTTIVYHDTETLARRGYRFKKPGEIVAYRSIEDFDKTENKKHDKVVNLSSKPTEKVTNHAKDNIDAKNG